MHLGIIYLWYNIHYEYQYNIRFVYYTVLCIIYLWYIIRRSLGCFRIIYRWLHKKKSRNLIPTLLILAPDSFIKFSGASESICYLRDLFTCCAAILADFVNSTIIFKCYNRFVASNRCNRVVSISNGYGDFFIRCVSVAMIKLFPYGVIPFCLKLISNVVSKNFVHHDFSLPFCVIMCFVVAVLLNCLHYNTL